MVGHGSRVFPVYFKSIMGVLTNILAEVIQKATKRKVLEDF
jgi:hypothetical protein